MPRSFRNGSDWPGRSAFLDFFSASGGIGFSLSGTAAAQAADGWATVLDQGRIRFDTEATIEIEGIGTLEGRSHDSVLKFLSPARFFIDGRQASRGSELRADQELEVRSTAGQDLWKIRIARDPANRTRGRKIGSAQGTRLTFVFEPDEPSFYRLQYRRDKISIQGWVSRALEVGAKFDPLPSPPGVLRVRAVLQGGPADQAGLTLGDLVTSIDGQPADRETLFRALASKDQGDTLRLTVERGDGSFFIRLKLKKSPISASQEFWFGRKYNIN